MADTVQEEILTYIQHTYLPFLKELIPFLEKNVIVSPEELHKLEVIYTIFTTAPPDLQVRAFQDSKIKLEAWYKKAQKIKETPSNSDDKPSLEEAPKLIDYDTLQMHDTQHCVVSLPEPNMTVSTEELPGDVIDDYTTEVNKKNMEETLDQHIVGSASSNEVVNIQKDLSEERNAEEGSSENNLEKCVQTNIRMEQMNVLDDALEQPNSNFEVCTKLFISESKVNMLLHENLSKDKEIEVLKIRNDEIKAKYAKMKIKNKKLKKSITDREVQLSAMTEENEEIKVKIAKRKTKYKNLKKSITDELEMPLSAMTGENEEVEAKYIKLKAKYKNLKRSLKDKLEGQLSTMTVNNRMTVIGPSLTVAEYKLNCCRNNNLSKFTGDLLEVVFGREKLGTSVLKGISGCTKVKSVLNPLQIQDIQTYVSKKFNVSSNEVRNAIRSKLNFCHKVYKKANGA